MLEFAQWIDAGGGWRWLGTVAFVVISCWAVSLPIAAVRGTLRFDK